VDALSAEIETKLEIKQFQHLHHKSNIKCGFYL